MKPAVAPTLVVALLIPAFAVAAYQRTRDPDWPCQQIKVPTLSLASVWAGPPVDPTQSKWQENTEVASLVRKIAQRRMPIDQARENVNDFARQSGARKQSQMLAAMAGLFDVLNQERDSVIAGLDRFGARQKTLAEGIRSENEKLQAMQADPHADPQAVQKLTNQTTLDVQMFEDRRQALRYACDVPGKIEQRLFALAQAIQQDLQ